MINSGDPFQHILGNTEINTNIIGSAFSLTRNIRAHVVGFIAIIHTHVRNCGGDEREGGRKSGIEW